MSRSPRTPDAPAQNEPHAHDRRALLGKLALGGAGAAVGAGLLSNGSAKAAAEPGALELGSSSTNTSTTPTSLVHTPGAARTAGPSTLSVGSAVPASDAPFPANVGGYGNELVANGLHGSTTQAAGYGAVAANLAPAAAGDSDPVPAGLALASAGGAHARFVPLDGAVVGPTPGKHTAGELYVDKDGTLWFTVPAPTTSDADAVRFVKLAGTPTTGAYHAITPQRAYDSRQPNYAVTGVLAPNSNRVVSLADGHSANGTVTTPDAIPEGATAAQINVTAAEMTGRNFLSVTAGDTTTTETSLVNWDDGATQIANAVTVPIDASRQIRVFNGNQTGSTHVIIDVFGYHF